MQVITGAIDTNADAIADPELRELLQQRLRDIEPYSLSDLGSFIVVEPGDSVETIDKQLGFPILTNRWTGVQFGQTGFTPFWEVLEEHGTCYEMVFVLSDDGYGVELFIPKHPSMDSELLSMCAEFSLPAQPILPN